MIIIFMEIHNLLKICDCYNIDFLWLNVDQYWIVLTLTNIVRTIYHKRFTAHAYRCAPYLSKLVWWWSYLPTMFIKSMVIDGFKSYAQRTEIIGFDPLFNAITGLNGSGKSNILDSICFLLGITNLSHVRKEDVPI